jgi:predicted acylesterase/phospholipase RssA
MNRPPSERFQILSLDGGGIKGLFAAAILTKLEEDLNINIIDHFDLIVGTSTGGIIALALGLAIQPKEIVKFYVEKGPKIFGNPTGIRNLSHWLFRKFNQLPLQEALVECFENRRLADSKKRLVITSYNLGEDNVYLFKTPHHVRLKRDYKIPMWKVALATSAAPTYFPAFKGIESIRLIDGGVWANNPTMVGIVEATSMLEVPLSSISVLSLGTSDEIVRRPEWLDWTGKLPWAKSASAFEVIMRGQSLGANNQALHLLGAERVSRLDPKVPRGLLALDRLNIDELLSRAACESRVFGPTFEKKFMSHKVLPYKPLYT